MYVRHEAKSTPQRLQDDASFDIAIGAHRNWWYLSFRRQKNRIPYHRTTDQPDVTRQEALIWHLILQTTPSLTRLITNMSHPQVNFLQTSFDDASVLKSRRATTSKVTVKAQLQQLRETGRYDCFNLQWKPIYDDRGGWPVTRTQFWDSDVAKWIEGACYLLTEDYDAEVDAAVQEIVSMIRSAKQPDGYLNVYFTLVEPDARWSNIRDRHEL